MPKSRFLPALLLLFVGSGCAALIYEIVWFQLLQLVIGATAVSLGVLLATFMGGMCAGSLLLARFVAQNRHPLRIYAQLELGIGIFGLLILFAVPLLGRSAIVLLLPPTLLMGATLPAVARWVEITPAGVSWLGFFYGGNIAGAVVGSLLAGFYLLRLYDMATATYVAVALNMTMAALAWILSRRTAYRVNSDQGSTRQAVKARPTATRGADLGVRAPVYVAIALSGLAALGAEVIWTRVLSLLFGGTVYTFSIIAAVFLFGIGSAAGAWLARDAQRPGVLLAGCQAGVAMAVAWGAALIARAYPYWPIDPALAAGPWFNFQIELLRAFLAVVPAACCWGASFPLALAAAGPRAGDPARLVGAVYAANTIGAVVGAVLFSLLIIPSFGTQDAQRFLIWAALAASVVMLAWGAPADAKTPAGRRAAIALASLAIAVAAAASVAPIPPEVIAYGRQIATFKGASFLYEEIG